MREDVKKFIEEIEKAKKGEVDLSRDEDLAIAVMNLISLEEHFYFTAMKTDDQKYLDMLQSVREIRKKMLKEIVKAPKGEEWCISKHLLAASMRLMEVGTKELSKNGAKSANRFFEPSFDLFSLFFAMNLGMIEKKELEKTKKGDKYMEKFSAAVKKIVDCCKEW
jgi:hypothetical protein